MAQDRCNEIYETNFLTELANMCPKDETVYQVREIYLVPCGEDCPLKLATAKQCFFHHDKNDIYMTFDVPLINRKLKLIEAYPFKLMIQTENKPCTVKYTGPTNAIVTTDKACNP